MRFVEVASRKIDALKREEIGDAPKAKMKAGDL